MFHTWTHFSIKTKKRMRKERAQQLFPFLKSTLNDFLQFFGTTLQIVAEGDRPLKHTAYALSLQICHFKMVVKKAQKEIL